MGWNFWHDEKLLAVVNKLTTSFFNANNVNRTVFYGFFQSNAIFFPAFAKLKCSDDFSYGMKFGQTLIIHKPIVRGYIAT